MRWGGGWGRTVRRREGKGEGGKGWERGGEQERLGGEGREKGRGVRGGRGRGGQERLGGEGRERRRGGGGKGVMQGRWMMSSTDLYDVGVRDVGGVGGWGGGG